MIYYFFLFRGAGALRATAQTEENMANGTFVSAKKAKQDEFCTQYADIQTGMNAYLEYAPNVFNGGNTSEANCRMLCKHHNRVKGNC